MNDPLQLPSESPPVVRHPAPAAVPVLRVLYWLVRRELWESRSIYLGPLFVAGVMLAGFALWASNLPEAVRALSDLDAERQRAFFGLPLDIPATVLVMYMFVGAATYSVIALHTERSDRSILFWKSLPVSDTITVLSKAAIPLFVLPVLTFALVLATQLATLVVSTMILLIDGQSIAAAWSHLAWGRRTLVLLYTLKVVTLWHAPLYAAVLLCSSFGRRAGFLALFLPALAIVILEKFAFGTDYFLSLVKYRVSGVFTEAFVPDAQAGYAMAPFTLLDSIPDPLRFAATPGLWIGLAVAVAVLYGTVRLRRLAGPL